MQTVTKPDLTSPHIRVLGTAEIFATGASRPQPLQGATAKLLAVLVAAADEGVAMDDVSLIFWPDGRPEVWRSLVRWHVQRLEQQLPSSWTVDVSDILRLNVTGSGWVDAWQLLCGLDVPGDPRSTPKSPVPAPYPGVRHRAAIRRSAQTINNALRSEPKPTFAASTEGTGHQTITCHLLDATQQHCLITHSNAESPLQMDAVRNLAESQARDNPLIVMGGVSEGLPFGDIAVAFAALRWDLLNIEGRSTKAQVAAGWRLVRDAMKDASEEMPAELVIVNGHLLDEHSSTLVAQLVTYPVEPALRVTVSGDAASREDAWIHLTDALTNADGVHLSICDDCPLW